MKQIKVSVANGDDRKTTATLDCFFLKGKKLSEKISIEIECRIKALPVPESYKEELRILIAAYGVLKSGGE